MEADVTISSEVDKASQRVLREFGQIDILVNNAGVVLGGTETVVDLSNDQWDKEIAVMLTGTFYCTRAVLPDMIERRSGKIINISSLAARVGRPGVAASYCAAKAGILGLTISVAQSVAKYGVNVNAICPGLILTEIHRSFPAETLAKLQSNIPLSRGGLEGVHGRAEDIANAVLFLASGESDYITGTCLNVSGGQVWN
jgi:3-oxoacyl-[acyl-carrier protein] reductase